jgi:short-chain fatty acids transporter
MTALVDHFSALGSRLTSFTERWVPDSWVLCMILTVIALGLAVFGVGVSVQDAVLAWGGGMWTLLELAMQFTMALLAAHACVSSRVVYRLLDRLAGLPNPERPLQAVVLIAVYSVVAAYLNWALTVVASALFIPFVCRRNPKADIRILIAAAYLGICTVWHGGLSASAPLILATPGNPLHAPASGAPVVDRLIPVTETLFAPFNLVYLVVVSVVGLLTLVLLHPRRGAVTLNAQQAEAILPQLPEDDSGDATPRGHIDRFRGWSLLAVVLILYPLGHSIVTSGFGASWTINAYNMVFLATAFLLHGRPDSLLKAVPRGVSTASGIILQFPFYAGIFGIMNSTGLGQWIGEIFVGISTTDTYPLIVYLYSGLLNLFVPSGGSKWLIEAPYLLPAARELGVSTVTTVLAYGYGDSTSNLVQPFWALPILTVTRVRFGDVLGYTFLVGLACFIVSVIAMLLIPVDL